MAVMMSRFCRLWLLEKEEFCSTIFSSSSMSSPWRPALMKLLTATLTCSGLRLSGSAVELTCKVLQDYILAAVHLEPAYAACGCWPASNAVRRAGSSMVAACLCWSLSGRGTAILIQGCASRQAQDDDYELWTSPVLSQASAHAGCLSDCSPGQ